ncbi:MAG: molybdate ABC transporter substrate-binding protein [Nitrospinae bacterium]|nr:molybdate ABC transporter substrate-binding protein [Nitrospinota bacterium]
MAEIASAETISIAVSANMRDAFTELQQSFEKRSGHTVKAVIASSGKLTAQIKNGAPYDIFLAANMKYPESLYASGIGRDKPTVYAYGSLILWSKKKLLSIDELSNSTIAKIALANPRFAPYGIASIQVLEGNKAWKDIERKFIYGNSISQVNSYIFSGSVDAAFTSKSSIHSEVIKKKGFWIEINKSYTPIAQGVLVINDKTGCKDFMSFLFSDEGKELLKKFSYTTL